MIQINDKFEGNLSLQFFIPQIHVSRIKSEWLRAGMPTLTGFNNKADTILSCGKVIYDSHYRNFCYELSTYDYNNEWPNTLLNLGAEKILTYECPVVCATKVFTSKSCVEKSQLDVVRNLVFIIAELGLFVFWGGRVVDGPPNLVQLTMTIFLMWLILKQTSRSSPNYVISK